MKIWDARAIGGAMTAWTGEKMLSGLVSIFWTRPKTFPTRLAWCIYQVAGKHRMRRLSLRPHARGIGGTVGQLRAGERGAEGGAQRLETRCPADSVSFEPIAAQFQAVASARPNAGETRSQLRLARPVVKSDQLCINFRRASNKSLRR